MHKLVRSNHAFNLALHILVPVVLCVLIIVVQIKEQQDDRTQHLDRAQMMAHDLGSTVAISIAGSIENVDLTLQAAVDLVKHARQHHALDAAEMHRSLLGLQQRVPTLVLLGAADSQGNVQYSSADSHLELPNVADRSYFQALRDAATSTMYITQPLLGRVTQRWVLICARRIDLPDGKFGGVVFASVELQGYLDKLIGGKINLSGDDVFLLRDDEGNAIIRYAKGRQEMELTGTKIYSDNLMRLGSNRAESGSYISKSAVDHIERIYYYQRISGRPMNLVVGISVRDALSEWQREANKAWVITGTLLGVIVLAGYLIFRSRSHQLQAFAELQYMQTQLEQSNLELARLSTTDELTGLANRRRFDEVGPHEWLRAMRKHEYLAVAMLDVDYFKIFNDRYGHQAGDQCLARIARALASGLRDGSDFIARYGGEEFVILLPGQNAQEAYDVLERLRKIVEALEVPHLGSTAASVITISAGFASIVPEPGITLESLLEQADQCLYAAKRKGKNQVVGGSESVLPFSRANQPVYGA